MYETTADGTTNERSWSGDDQLQETITADTTIYAEQQSSNNDDDPTNVNFADIETFMTILFGDATPTLQTFDDVKDRKSKDLIRVIHGMTEDDIPTLMDINQKGGGIFVMVNLGDGNGRTAVNVVEVTALFLDLDGSPLQPVLDAGLKPHIIVESSPERYHAYWLVEDCPLAMFPPIQKAIARRFNGDLKVHDLSRVMRMAGFMHNKNEPFLSRILETNDIPKYTYEQIVTGLGLTVSEQDAEHKPVQKKKASVDSKVTDALNYIDPATLEYDQWRNIGFALHHELGDDGKCLFDSWSKTDVARYSSEVIDRFWQGIKEDPENPVTVGTIIKMAKDRGWSPPPPPPPIILELNKKYFVSQENGKTSIYSEDYDHQLKRNVLYRSSFGDFLNFHNNKNVYVGNNDNGEPKYAKKGRYWIDHHDRRQYDGIVMAPEQVVDNMYNIWKGFSVKPKAGKWKLMILHIRDVICMGDDKLFKYLIRWMARAIQIPSKPAEVAIVLQGARGIGKGTFANALCKLFGQHGLQVSHGQHLSGKFNAHLRDCVFLYADEAFWAGDKQGENTLKAMITEPLLCIEGKGRDLISAPNMLHILMASNNDWVIPAGTDERRYCVLKVSDEKKGDYAYFNAIELEMSNGGLEAMLYDLQRINISGFNFRDVPQTIGLQEQKLQSLDPFQDWWYNKLVDGSLVSTEGSYWGDIPCQVLYDDYVKASGQVGVRYKSSPTQFGLLLPKVLPDGFPKKHNRTVDKFSFKWYDGTATRCNHYTFPALDKARSYFEKYIGCSIKWNDQPVKHLCTTLDDENNL
jgi:hypothetical protein